jgi:hypothetical protein
MKFMAVNVIVRFKRDLDGVYGYKRYNGYSEREREVVVRECQRERMRFKLDYAGVYGYG